MQGLIEVNKLTEMAQSSLRLTSQQTQVDFENAMKINIQQFGYALVDDNFWNNL